MADVTQEERERAEQRELPERDAAREWLESMMLIRRFEERAASRSGSSRWAARSLSSWVTSAIVRGR